MVNFITSQLQLFAATCGNEGKFFGLPAWYKYLDGGGGIGTCNIIFDFKTDIPLVALAILEILLRIVGLVAIFYVVFGGVKYVVSQGEPDKTAAAKGTVINALVGLIIATLAVGIVAFVGSKIT